MIPLLVVRPEPGASKTEARAKALGLDVIRLPLFHAEPLSWTAPDPAPFDAVMMTSANAARLGGKELDLLTQLPLYAVGCATAEAARRAGFTRVIAGSGDAQTLVDMMARAGCQRVIHLAGIDRVATNPNFDVTMVPVYQAQIGAVTLPSGRAIALVHSPRAGRRLAELCIDKSTVDIVAISAAAADAVGGGWRSVVHADHPTDAAMLALAAPLCEGSR